jgi:hypothetical protein
LEEYMLAIQTLYACVCVGLLTRVQSVPTLPISTFGVNPVPVDCQIENVPVLALRNIKSSWLLACPVKLPTSASAQPAFRDSPQIRASFSG